jgi:hypothetical protein
VLFVLSLPSITQSTSQALNVSVCDILKKPSAFNGKVVRHSGFAHSEFEYLGLSDGECRAVWIDYADDKRVRPKPSFQMVRDTKFAEFEYLILANKAAAVLLIGRLDAVDEIRQRSDVRKTGSKSGVVSFHTNGFGHMGQYKARLVLQRVVDVASSSRPE